MSLNNDSNDKESLDSSNDDLQASNKNSGMESEQDDEESDFELDELDNKARTQNKLDANNHRDLDFDVENLESNKSSEFIDGTNFLVDKNQRETCPSEPDIKLRKKTTERLDSIRFSMYAIQDSQLNEIDALLSELNDLQSTLEFRPEQNIQFIDATNNHTNSYVDTSFVNTGSSGISSKASTQSPFQANDEKKNELEGIDQQFDEVLKFLAQSINDHGSSPVLSSTSLSSISLLATPNYDNNSETDNSKKNEIKTENSSKSSGIGEDICELSNTELLMFSGSKNSQTTINSKDNLNINPNQIKRNSSDSAFIDAMPVTSSLSLGTIASSSQSKNKKQISNPIFLHSSMNIFNSTSSGHGSDKSPNSQTDSISSVNSNVKAESKAEQIRIALEKLKEANIKKIIVKAYTEDGCTKSVIIDETMKAYDVMLMLFSKNHTKPTINYSIVEFLPKFHMERIFEDHENIVDAMSNWARDSDNQIIFIEKEEKYDLFLRPEFYLLNEPSNKVLEEVDRLRISSEFFQNIGSPVPEIEGQLYIKNESKKSWKKHYCVLRQSGLYSVPKGKTKKGLECLLTFEKLDLYYGINWKKEFKSPTDFCFGLKFPQIQKKSSKYNTFICCENSKDLKRWFNGIRVAKFGKQLFDNYKRILELSQSGRLPAINHRRLSASISSQRPRSSYSINSSNNNEDPTNNKNNTESEAIIKCDTSLVDSTNQVGLNSSLLIRKDSIKEVKHTEQFNSLNINSSNKTDSITINDKQMLKNTLNSLLLDSTNLPNHNLKFNFTQRTDIDSNLEKHGNFSSKQKPQLPQRMLDFEPREAILKSKNITNISEQLFKESFYDLPSPPIELLNVKEVSNQNDDEIKNTPSVARKMYLNNDIQPTNLDNKNRFISPVLVNQTDLSINKPPFKRTQSSEREKLSNVIESNSNENQVIGKDLLRRVSNRLSNGNFITENVVNDKVEKCQLISNELSILLERQKKKIEDSESKKLQTNCSDLNTTNVKKAANSPTLAKKPPPPPRSDRSLQNRRNIHETMENRNFS